MILMSCNQDLRTLNIFHTWTPFHMRVERCRRFSQMFVESKNENLKFLENLTFKLGPLGSIEELSNLLRIWFWRYFFKWASRREFTLGFQLSIEECSTCRWPEPPLSWSKYLPRFILANSIPNKLMESKQWVQSTNSLKEWSLLY